MGNWILVRSVFHRLPAVPGQLTRALLVVLSVHAALPTPGSAQTPQPFPRPSGQTQPPPLPPRTEPPGPTTQPASTPGTADAPTEEALGVPIYPSAQFLGSYDAGRGQRFYLFGVASSFADMVTYYRNTLKQRGEVLFETPPTHIFEVGRFREETMAFPPGVTVKDYTWGGSPGFPNPKRGTAPTHFPTVLQIVPAPGVP